MTETPLENIEVGPEVTAGGEPCSAGIGMGAEQPHLQLGSLSALTRFPSTQGETEKTYVVDTG